MDISKLKLEPSDFSNISNWKWRTRRILLGWILFLYYSYAIMFMMNIALPELFAPPTSEPSAFKDLGENHLILMMTFGFLGSVFFITRTFVRTGRTNDCSVAWYLTRPLQGVLMALFIYYAFRAGQFVFYSGGKEVAAEAINIFMLSILAILAGMFTDHAYDRLYAIAENLLKPKNGKTEGEED